MYVKGAVIRKSYNLSGTTLRKWSDEGKIDTIQMPGSNQRLYNIESFEKFMHIRDERKSDTTPRVNYIYARVSSEHQRADLDRQIRDMRQAFPDHKIIQDIGSGLNFHRPGLQTLLEHVRQGLVAEIAVMHRDRLARFGLELLEWIFTTYHTKILVFGQDENPKTYEQELSDDIISIITVFVAKHNGRRSAENRKRRNRERAQETREGSTSSSEEKGPASKRQKTREEKKIGSGPTRGGRSEKT
jgi:predicted site-specific integrase-resolvase